MSDWIAMEDRQPAQEQRILCRGLAGTAITSYDRFCFEHWGITHWKPMPADSVRSTLRPKPWDQQETSDGKA
jgi:hypothetical protein